MVTQRDAIYRGDNMSKCITFLLPQKAAEADIGESTVFLSYIRPDGDPDMVILDQEAEKYNESYYRYILPVTCKMSRYPGQILMWLQICSGDPAHPVITKTGECVIHIHESRSMDDCLCDHQLTAMYQIKKKLDAVNDTYNPADGKWEDMEIEENASDDGSASWDEM